MFTTENKNEKNKKDNNTNIENTVDADIFKNGTINALDLIMPDGFKEFDDYLYMGPNKYARVFSILTYPHKMDIGFFNDLFKIGNVDVNTYIDPIPDSSVIARITAKYSKLKANLILQAKRGIPNYSLQYATNDLDALREGIQTNQERLFYTQVTLVVWGTNVDSLNNNCSLIKDICARKSLKLKTLVFEQKKGFLSSLPNLNIKTFDNKRNMNTGGVACMIPMGNNEIFHEHGMYLGRTFSTKYPVFFDPFASVLSNPHIFLCGGSGAGKSVTLKVLASRSAASGKWVVMLDPEGEDKQIIDYIGGQYINLKAGVKAGINPFELEIEVDEYGKKSIDIYSKMSEIREMISIFSEKFNGRPLQGIEITKLDEAVRKLYSDRNINENPESLYDDSTEKDGNFYVGKVKKIMPTLTDLRNELMNFEEMENLCEIMKEITGDGPISMFDCQSTIDLSNRVVGINFKEISDEFTKFFATVNILSWIWSKLSNYKFKGIQKEVINDEGWFFAKYQRSAAFLETIARRGRKYQISLITATQMINEFLATDSGKAVINQAATKIIMKQEAAPAHDVKEFFHLSENCAEYMTQFVPGQAILMTGGELSLLRIEPFDFEWDFVQTGEKRQLGDA